VHSPIDQLHAKLESWARDAQVPGAAVGLVHGEDETILTTGVTSVAAPAPVDADTLFMIGSTTKTFTGALIMALVEDGILDLDAPVTAYLPDLALADERARSALTIRHLLTHTGGFAGDFRPRPGREDDALARAVARFAELPQVFAPGEVFSYSNAGMLLAGHLAATAAGVDYEELVRTRILAPLGLASSFFRPAEVLRRRHALGHQLRGGAPVVVPVVGLVTRDAAPAGGLWSSARDQVAWARFHLTGHTRGTLPISDAARAAMAAPQRRAALHYETVGLGWLHTRHGPTIVTQHDGNVSGMQISALVMVPQRRFAVTVLSNGPGGGQLVPRIVDFCLENFAGLPRLAPRPVHDVDVQRYLGRYDTGQLAFTFTCDADGLRASVQHDGAPSDGPPAIRLVFTGPHEFAHAADTRAPLGRFLCDPDGHCRAVELGGRTAVRTAGLR
jgi:CubicO group peptidase (beta-lactamase class C family)